MIRIRVLATVSRENNRLPAAEINKKLGCTGLGLPFDQANDLLLAKDSGYVLYVFEPNECIFGIRRPNGYFILVETWMGHSETILDEGEVPLGFRVHRRQFNEIDVVGIKLGRFKFYTTYAIKAPGE